MFNSSRIDLLEKRVKELQSLLDLQYSKYNSISAIDKAPQLKEIERIVSRLDILAERNKQQEDTIKNLTEAIATQKEREELIEQYKKAGGTVKYKASTDTPIIQYKQISLWGIYRLAGVADPGPDIEHNYTIAEFKNVLNEQIAKQHKEKCKQRGKK